MTLNLNEIYALEVQRANGAIKKRYHGATVKFQEEVYQDELATTAANGVPKFKSRDMISIRYPGQDETVKRVEEQDKLEYGEQWAAFQSGKEQPLEGTALEQWPLIPRNIVEELRYYSIRTVEQLRDLTDDAKRKLGPLVSWHKKAVEWDKAANGKQAELVALREQLQRQTERADRLEDKIHQLLQRIDANEGNNLSVSNRGRNSSSE